MQKCLLIIEKNPSGGIGIKKAKERGLHVILFSSNKYYNKVTDEERSYIDSFVEIDTNNIDIVVQKARNVNAKIKIDGAVTFFEYYVPVTAYVARALNLPGISVETSAAARNKCLMRDRMSSAGIPCPLFKCTDSINEAKDFAAHIGFPNIIKPPNLCASRNVFKNSSIHELENNFNTIIDSMPPFGLQRENSVLVEEFLKGPEYSVEAISRNGCVHIIAITKKMVRGGNCFVEVGHSLPAKLDNIASSEIHSIVTSTIKSLKISNAVTHTELIYTRDGPKIVEIAARLGGDRIPELVEHAMGVDLWNCAISLALGESVEPKPTKCLGAAIGFITANAGKISMIRGTKEAMNMAGVCDVNICCNVGDLVNPLMSSADRLGEVIAVADDPIEAEKICNAAMNKIELTIT